jgi:L-amino acid N-acyltransferase YncA
MTEGVRTYPANLRIKDGEVTVRYMTPADSQAMLAFARSLPEHDLLFLRRDITQPEVVERWAKGIEQGGMTTVLADAAGQVVGYATIDRSEISWSRHVAELRVMVGPSMRGKGLGRLLTQEAFAIALGLGIEKMVAQMTLDQKGAIEVFEGIGFRPEALLKDQVKDRAGKKHDLLVLTHEVAAFRSQMDAYGVTEALGG